MEGQQPFHEGQGLPGLSHIREPLLLHPENAIAAELLLQHGYPGGLGGMLKLQPGVETGPRQRQGEGFGAVLRFDGQHLAVTLSTECPQRLRIGRVHGGLEGEIPEALQLFEQG